jgi:hypothetical protein
MEKNRIWDPGWKIFGFEIRDKHPGFATLLFCFYANLIFLLYLAFRAKMSSLFANPNFTDSREIVSVSPRADLKVINS